MTDGEPNLLPEAARFAWWASAWLRGDCGVDDAVDGIVGSDAAHVMGSAQTPTEPATSLLEGLLSLRAARVEEVGFACPTEGDLVGLGGPAAFNVAAADAGQAVVAAPWGLIPRRTGAAVVWEMHRAQRRQLVDVSEADRGLRQALLDAAGDLAELDVARWRPEAADLLIDLRRGNSLPAPPGTPVRWVALAGRASHALAVVAVATGGATDELAADDVRRRDAALRPLAAAARRALVAACSPIAWPPADAGDRPV